MVQVLRPDIQLAGDGWGRLAEKYKLKQVVPELHLQALWRQMQRCWQPVIWYLLPEEEQTAAKEPETKEGTVIAAVTLGAGVDELQAGLNKSGRLLDAYVIDCLSMEALRCFYGVLEKELQRKGFYICRYSFPEPDGRNGNETQSLLERLQTDIRLSPEGMMRPLKSVVYRGVLTEEQSEGCGAVCAGCGNMACRHRDSANTASYREPGVLKYSYGYQRIFGKK